MCRRGWQKLSRFPTLDVSRNDTSFSSSSSSTTSSSSSPPRALDSEISSSFPFPPVPRPPIRTFHLPPPRSPFQLPTRLRAPFHARARAHACVHRHNRALVLPSPRHSRSSVYVCRRTCIKSPRRVEDLRVRGRWYQNGRDRTHNPRVGAIQGNQTWWGITHDGHTCTGWLMRVNQSVCGR